MFDHEEFDVTEDAYFDTEDGDAGGREEIDYGQDHESIDVDVEDDENESPAEDFEDESDYVDEDDEAADDDYNERGDDFSDDSQPPMWDSQEFATASQQQQVAMYAAQQADLLSREFEEQFGYAPNDEVRFSWMKQAESQAWNYVQTEQTRRMQFRQQVSNHRSTFKEHGYPESAADELVRIVDDCGTTVLDDPYMKMMAVELAIGRAIVRGGGLSQQKSRRSSHSAMEMPTGLGEAKFSRAQSELIESVRRTVYGGRRLSLEEKKRIAGYD